MNSEQDSPIRVLCLYQEQQSLKPVEAFLERCSDAQWLESVPVDNLSLAYLKALQPQAVLINLPVQTLQLLRSIAHLRSTLPASAIIVLGPVDDPAYRAGLMAQGADGFVRHDLIEHELLPAMRDALGLRKP